MIRKPGDPVSGDFVRACRARVGLTQEQFAEAIGIPGGEAVVSCWEKDRSQCQGPAAELVIERFGAGERITGLQHAALSPEEQALYEQLPHGDVCVRTRPTP